MKKITILFVTLILGAGIFTFCNLKGNGFTSSPEIQAARDAIKMENTVAEIKGIISDYQRLYADIFVAPVFKPGGAQNSTRIIGTKRKDSCVSVIIEKMTVDDSATIKLTIDYGPFGCACSDGKTRKGSIVNLYSWIKAGGWSKESTIDNLIVNGEIQAGTISSSFGLVGADKHSNWAEKTTMRIPAKDGSWKEWSSDRNREMIKGNGTKDINKIVFRVTGSSKGSNSSGFSYSSRIQKDNPLIKPANSLFFTKGTMVMTNSNGKIVTLDYGDGSYKKVVTIKTPGTKNGKGATTMSLKLGEKII
jgi:hypothetical protein